MASDLQKDSTSPAEKTKANAVGPSAEALINGPATAIAAQTTAMISLRDRLIMVSWDSSGSTNAPQAPMAEGTVTTSLCVAYRSSGSR